jgi:hypothetical protein
MNSTGREYRGNGNWALLADSRGLAYVKRMPGVVKHHPSALAQNRADLMAHVAARRGPEPDECQHGDDGDDEHQVDAPEPARVPVRHRRGSNLILNRREILGHRVTDRARPMGIFVSMRGARLSCRCHVITPSRR